MMKINCCRDRHCYPSLKQGHFINGTKFLGLFENPDSESALCSIDITKLFRPKCEETFRKSATAKPLYTSVDTIKHLSILEVARGTVIALVGPKKIYKMSLVDGEMLKNYEFDLGSRDILATGFRGSDWAVSTRQGIEMIDMASCHLYGQSKSVCLAIEDLLCGWNPETLTCEPTINNSNILQTFTDQIDDNIEIHVDPEITIQRFRSKPVTISTLTNETLCDELKWYNEQFEPVPMDDYRYFISHSIEHQRAQLVLYPPKNEIGQLDGLYYLEYLIRGQSVRRSRFRVVPFASKTVFRAALPIISPAEEELVENIEIASTVDYTVGLWSLLVIPIIALTVFAAIFQRNRSLQSTQVNSNF